MMPTGAYTTLIDVYRTSGGVDPFYGGGEQTLVEGGLGAYIDFGAGSRRTAQGGTTVASTFTATCEPGDVRSGDLIVDTTNGQRYTVEAAFPVTDSEQPHVQLSLEQIGSDA